MPAKPATTQPAPRTPDTFQLARQLYNARTRHFDKADALLRAASIEVRSLVEAREAADAEKTIDLVPTTSSPD